MEAHERGNGRGPGRPGWIPVLALGAAGLLGGPGGATAQRPVDAVRVFLDCQTHGCPRDEFRTEIGFVDWVREPADADLHVILTAQGAGAGVQYVFDLVGQGEFDGEDLRLAADVSSTATNEERLRTLTRTFQAGLMPYIARRGYADRLDIVDRATPEGRARRVDPASDPWRLWVFRVGGAVDARGEEQRSSYALGGRFSANRTTPDWKIDAELDGRYSETEVTLTDSVYTYQTDAWESAVLVVRSLTPHWSAGGEVEVNTSTRLNRKVGGRAALALEWDYYPYEQANRRQLLVHYQLGYSHVRYEEKTIFGKLQEDLLDQRLAVVWEARQPWGDGRAGVFYSNFMHDWTKYRLSLAGEISVRLVRGLELDIEAGYDLIRDQIYLPAEELGDEEILVQRRQLATGYEYDLEVGLSYRFGSIFNNVVNNRFPWIVRRF